MVSTEHELVTDLSEHRPQFIGELLRTLFGPVPTTGSAAWVGSADLTESTPTELRADQVVLFGDRPDPVPVELGQQEGKTRDDKTNNRDESNNRNVELAVVVEMQRARDPNKLFTWPSYVALARARHRCPAWLLVFCPDAEVASWAGQRIKVSPDGFELCPKVVGPHNIGYVRDKKQIEVSPELGVLSTIMHSREGERGQQVLTALVAGLAPTAAHGVGPLAEVHQRYLDGIEALIPEEMQEIMRTLMKEHGYQGSFSRNRAEGKAEGKAEGVLKVLRARGLEVPDEVTERVMGCVDSETLDAWLVRAMSVSSAKELFD